MTYFDMKGFLKALGVKDMDEAVRYVFSPEHQDEPLVQEFLALYALVKEGEPHGKGRAVKPL